jgi:hypothetical protein
LSVCCGGSRHPTVPVGVTVLPQLSGEVAGREWFEPVDQVGTLLSALPPWNIAAAEICDAETYM